MPVMNVRVVRMTMHQLRMPMPMRVRLAGRISRSMRVLMMLVMDVRVFVFQSLMPVFMFVPFREVQPHPQAHQNCRHQKPATCPVAQKNNRHRRSNEWTG